MARGMGSLKRMVKRQTARDIGLIVIHCTATIEGKHIDRDTIDRWHKDKGWSGIGYHYIVELDGRIVDGRPDWRAGAHVRGYNANSIGIVYVGGLDNNLKAKDTRTQAQKDSLAGLVVELHRLYPQARICGHRDLSPDKDGDGVVERHEWVKECPCFDVEAWWEEGS